MKAIYYQEHGGPEVLQYGDVDEVKPGPGEVLLEVKAVSLNHIDLFLRAGLPGIRLPLPHIPGCDASGVVVELGQGVDGVEVGQRVLMDPSISCGQCEFCLRGDASMCLTYKLIGETAPGTYRERLVIPAQNAVPIPDDMSFDDAASIAMVFLTAWNMLIGRGKLQPGEDVLILGAAAGVGIACIQIAKLVGARVFAAAGTSEKLELCRELGADILINYTDDDFARRVRAETGKRGVDMVVDYVGQETWVRSLSSLVRGGRVVTCGATTGYAPQTDLRHIFFRQLKVIGSTMGSRNDLLTPLKFIAEGKMRTVVTKVFDLKDSAQAHRMMEQRQSIGKIVLRVGA